MGHQRYTDEFRIEAVRQVTEKGHPVREVADRLGVSGHSLYQWVKKYGPANGIQTRGMESSPFLVETLHGSRWVMQPSSSISSTSSPQFSALAGGLRGALEDDGSRSPSSGAVRCR